MCAALTLARLHFLPSVFLLSPPPPPWLSSLFHSANINRVIWKSRVVENLTELRFWKGHLHDKLFQFPATFRKMRCLPCIQQERNVLGLIYRSAISSCVQVINSGVMSIYSSSYCRLLTRMTSCWLALLMGNSSFTFLCHKAAESTTGTLFSSFYIHITTSIQLLLSVYVFLGPFKWWKVACPHIQ